MKIAKIVPFNQFLKNGRVRGLTYSDNVRFNHANLDLYWKIHDWNGLFRALRQECFSPNLIYPEGDFRFPCRVTNNLVFHCYFVVIPDGATFIFPDNRDILEFADRIRYKYTEDPSC